MSKESNLPGLDTIQKIGLLTPILDWLFDKFQRSPEKRREAAHRRNLRKYDKGKRNKEKYLEVFEEIERIYFLEEVVNSGDYFVSNAPGVQGVLLIEKGNNYDPKAYEGTDDVISLTPCHFKGVNTTYGSGQKEYLPLLAHKTEDGDVITAWRIDDEAFEALRYERKIYFLQKTFNQPLQPVSVFATNPLIFPEDDPRGAKSPDEQ